MFMDARSRAHFDDNNSTELLEKFEA